MKSSLLERESRGGSIAAIAGLSNLLKKAYKHRKLGNQSNSRGVIHIVFCLGGAYAFLYIRLRFDIGYGCQGCQRVELFYLYS